MRGPGRVLEISWMWAGFDSRLVMNVHSWLAVLFYPIEEDLHCIYLNNLGMLQAIFNSFSQYVFFSPDSKH
jgi:hypothetical protein